MQPARQGDHLAAVACTLLAATVTACPHVPRGNLWGLTPVHYCQNSDAVNAMLYRKLPAGLRASVLQDHPVSPVYTALLRGWNSVADALINAGANCGGTQHSCLSKHCIKYVSLVFF